MSERSLQNIILCGVGGQGTILAAKILAAAAMNRGQRVMTAETIGMAQRGGSVFSHLRLGPAGSKGANSPLIPQGQAHLILGFEPAEAARHLPFLGKDGVVVAARQPLPPVSTLIGKSSYPAEEIYGFLESHSQVHFVDTRRALQELGSAKVLNVLLLGAAQRLGALDFSQEELLAAMRALVPEKFHALNERALKYDFT